MAVAAAATDRCHVSPAPSGANDSGSFEAHIEIGIISCAARVSIGANIGHDGSGKRAKPRT